MTFTEMLGALGAYIRKLERENANLKTELAAALTRAGNTVPPQDPNTVCWICGKRAWAHESGVTCVTTMNATKTR